MLLDEDFAVRASVRGQGKEDQTRATLQGHVRDSVDLGKMLSFAHLDLTRDDGWAEALTGARALTRR